MFKQTLRFLTVLLLAVTMQVGGVGTASAYLTPSNPHLNPANVGDPNTPYIPPGTNALHMPASYVNDYSATLNTNFIIGPGSVPDYLTTPNWAYSPPLTKFVDPLPGICIPAAPDGSNCDSDGTMAGKTIPVAIPDIVTYPGSDYYELELTEFQEPMHSDLLALGAETTLRGYRQVGVGTDTSGGCTDPAIDPLAATNCTHGDDIDFSNSQAHYLGPIIIAAKDRPVRVKFINSLPLTGEGGELFVPVDTTIMGAGSYDVVYDPITKQPKTGPGSGPGMFSDNRAELHLHGGRTPWISDGTPHQWITPAGEEDITPYNRGVSVENVPDMEDPGSGAQTYYWTNQQSSRLMFYHDHTWGITRVNVYVGEAAGYVIRDGVEQNLIDTDILPGVKSDGVTLSYGGEIPLVIQDKTFVDARLVDDPTTPLVTESVPAITLTDPTWAWGSQPWNGTPGAAMTPVTGDLWWPHVYMPAQNPFDITGIAPMGRWAYGPYFWPATPNEFQPVPNPYYHPDCDPANPDTPGSFGGFCQPFEIPSTPNPSWGAEAFMDTPVVNGTAYPTMTVEPKAYRLRILNAAHDRFFNLSLFVAADKNADTTAEAAIPGSAPLCTGGVAVEDCTEVRMLPANVSPDFPATWPADGRAGGVPDPATMGPDWIQIGTEGGFLPRPVVIPPQPVNWNADVTTFNAGNVNTGSLILGPAERADVVVDFSQFAGQTLIVYNDAPAPWPALDPHYDYYTGAPDNTGMGGYGPIGSGKGPNTRTIMQIHVSGDADPKFDLKALQGAFTPAEGLGVFRQSQDPIIAGQGNMNRNADPVFYEAFAFDAPPYAQDFSAYNDLYHTSFPTSWPNWGISRINDTSIKFKNPETGAILTADLQPKAIQDEQGETFDMFGRMRAGLGMTLGSRQPGQVGFVVQTYSDPSTEILEENGIQVWKITHNGVDTHPIHFHLFDVQVLNRVGWDGFIRLPDPTELGWKDTVRISPLEDTIVALKPVTPRVPFGVPESVRPMNPATALYSATELTPLDPYDGQLRVVNRAISGDIYLPGDPNGYAPWENNEIINLDWEYVWHCHILSHEENDMMRPMSFQFVEVASGAPSVLVPTVANDTELTLNWLDPTPVNEPSTLGNPQNEIRFDIYRSTDNWATSQFRGSALANQTTFSDTISQFTLYQYNVVAVNVADSTPSNMVQVISPGFKIEPSAGIGGTIAPDTIDYFQPHGSASYDIVAATDYHILDVLVDGSSVGPVSTYAFTDIMDNHTIAATFEINPTAAAPPALDVPATTTTGRITVSAVGVATPNAQYLIEYSTDGTNWSVGSNGPRSAIINLPAPGTYHFRVSVTATDYLQSDYTFGSDCTWTLSQASAPASLTVPLTTSNGRVTVTAASSSTPNAVYLIEYSEASVTNWFVGSDGPRSAIITLPAPGAYKFRVSVTAPNFTQSGYTDGSGNCTWAVTQAVASASLTVPAAPTNGRVTVTASSSPTPGALYLIEYSRDGGTNWVVGSDGPRSAIITINPLPVPAALPETYKFRVTVHAPGFANSDPTPGNVDSVWAANTPASTPATYTTPASTTNGRVTVTASTSATPGVRYLHSWSDNGGASWTMLDSPFRSVILTLPAASGKTYSFQVQVYDPTGLYAPSGFRGGNNTLVW